jgi:uncharacterized protein YutE (UPF0331/DUF86 family)
MINKQMIKQKIASIQADLKELSQFKDYSFDQVVDDYKRESFLLMGKIKVLPKDFAKKIADSVGLRNILVHQYRKLDEKIFYQAIKDCLVQYPKYCRYVLRYLEK